jgi:hypothetical protein
MKNTTLHKYVGSLVAVAALFASVRIAGAIEVDVTLTGVSNPVGGYNVLEFAPPGDGSFESASPALDSNGNPTGISVSGWAEDWSGYCSDNSGASITIEVDLPCGTFDISPGFAGPGSDTATITGDSTSFTGITGPATVYVNFLNNGFPVTTAGSITITGDPCPTEAEVDIELTGVSNPVGGYNVLEFAPPGDGSFESACPALDSNGNPTCICVSGWAEDWNGYCSDNSGASITFEIDLPCGTFDITPGFAGPGSDTATITGDSTSFTGITGPATVYVNFLNNGFPVTTAGSIGISQY